MMLPAHHHEREARCRVCAALLDTHPVITYSNMPSSAQGFPDAASLTKDRGSDLHIFQCMACGVVQIPGLPVPYYREVIRAAAYSPEMRSFRQQQFAAWAKTYNLIGKKVLEVGCGRGEYLLLLREADMDAHGLEASATSVAACREQRLPVMLGYPTGDTDLLGGAPYAAFATFNFMEHWPDPVGSLMSIARNLEGSAVGLVEVPNFDMIVSQALFSEFIADHLLYFTADTLRFTLQRSGFEVLSCQSTWHDYILSATVIKRRPIDLGVLKLQQEKVNRELHMFIARFPPHSVAVWGAGHQALATLALCDLGNKIRYVVDSAPSKQNRFTPATHLPIISQMRLLEDPPKAIIVMAASYSDEVVQLIYESYHLDLPIAVLRPQGLEIPTFGRY